MMTSALLSIHLNPSLKRMFFYECFKPLYQLVISHFSKESPRGVVAYVLDCDIVVSKFEQQSCYYIHFGTNTLGNGNDSSYPSPAIVLIQVLYTRKALALSNSQRLICH